MRDALTCQELSQLVRNRPAEVHLVSFSADGRFVLAAALGDTRIQIWDTVGKSLLQSTVLSGSSRAGAPAFALDSRRVVAGTGDGKLMIWAATNGQELLTWPAHRHPIGAVALSPDGQQIASTAGAEADARIWDAVTGRPRLSLRGHKGEVLCLTFSPDGTRMVTGSWDRTAKLWDTSNGQELLTLKGHQDAVTCAAFSRDGSRLVTASRDGTLKIWDAPRTEPAAQ